MAGRRATALIDPDRFRGIFTPLVTPLHDDETIDQESLRRLVDFQIDRGIHGLWAMGTTGEFPAFDEHERSGAIGVVVSQAAGRVPVIANVSDAATRLVLRHAERAVDAGADAIAVTPPYYYPSSQQELLDHYRIVARRISLPLFIYNIPQTVRTSLALTTALALAADGTVAGIKDSQNDLEWFRTLTLELDRQAIPFRAFAGTRHLIDASVLAGACGAIPSIANAQPELCVSAYEAAAGGDFIGAHSAQSLIVSLESRVRSDKGSRNAATIGQLKSSLQEAGVIASSRVTAPLLAEIRAADTV